MSDIYSGLYDLLRIYLFGGVITPGSTVDMIATLVATCGTLFLIAVPFILVWKVIKTICG